MSGIKAFENGYDLSDSVKLHETSFIICPDLWERESDLQDILTQEEIKEIKFLNDAGDDVSEDVRHLTNRKGGLYFFVAKAKSFPYLAKYLMYIGKAEKSAQQNLRKRCNEYSPRKPQSRPKIKNLIEKWGPYLYLNYIELENNSEIKDLEAKLICSLVPPFNSAIPEDKEVRDAVNAF